MSHHIEATTAGVTHSIGCRPDESVISASLAWYPYSGNGTFIASQSVISQACLLLCYLLTACFTLFSSLSQNPLKQREVVVFLCTMFTLILYTGTAPKPCHSHAAAVMQQRMFIFGGTQQYQYTFSGLHALNLMTGVWELATPTSPASSLPPSCFSHSLTAIRELLVLAGGCHTLGAGQSRFCAFVQALSPDIATVCCSRVSAVLCDALYIICAPLPL